MPLLLFFPSLKLLKFLFLDGRTFPGLSSQSSSPDVDLQEDEAASAAKKRRGVNVRSGGDDERRR